VDLNGFNNIFFILIYMIKNENQFKTNPILKDEIEKIKIKKTHQKPNVEGFFFKKKRGQVRRTSLS